SGPGRKFSGSAGGGAGRRDPGPPGGGPSALFHPGLEAVSCGADPASSGTLYGESHTSTGPVLRQLEIHRRRAGGSPAGDRAAAGEKGASGGPSYRKTAAGGRTGQASRKGKRLDRRQR